MGLIRGGIGDHQGGSSSADLVAALDSAKDRAGISQFEPLHDRAEQHAVSIADFERTCLFFRPDLTRDTSVEPKYEEFSRSGYEGFSRMAPGPPLSSSGPSDEPSPLGLTLRKTTSLLDLISMKLASGGNGDQGGSSSPDSVATQDAEKNRPGKLLKPSVNAEDKLKASNFPAKSLKIGTWERTSRYEGDLVGKCYYAKRKLVWEVLESGLKSKIEIQWSDISAMKATFPENLPGTLDIEVSRPPFFFRETNPRPRKHTLWQAGSDFTGGQATICKRHSLQFPEGVFNRHYQKLVESDPRLQALVEGALSSKPTPDFDPSIWLFNKKPQHMPCYQQIRRYTGFGRLVGVVVTLWAATLTVLCWLPHDQAYEVSSQTLKKYTPVVMGGVFVLALGSWVLTARKWFVGPISRVEEKDKV